MSIDFDIGFVGLGSIGLPIASNLISAGFNLKVHTRSRSAELDDCLKGSKPVESPSEAAKDIKILFICVSDDAAVENVLFGQKGAYKSLKPGNFVIDLSTISPDKSKYISERVSNQGIIYIDAPVTGGTEGARAAKLSIFLGCRIEVIKDIENVLSTISSDYYCFGEVGKGQEVKAINQVLVAGTYAAVAEAIALGESLELPMPKVVNALEKGAAGSWPLSNRSKAMIENEYPLGFKLSLHHKDLGIALDTAKSSGIELPITSKVREIEETLLSKGYSDYDISVIREAMKGINNSEYTK